MILGLMIISLLCPQSLAQSLHRVSGKNAVLHIPTTQDFELTADTNALHWSSLPWIQLQQHGNNTVSYHTKVKLQYSPKGIYCLYWCEDKKTTATLKEDFANLFHEDVVEIFFWTDESVPIYLEYELSPLNYELVILVPHLENRVHGWRPWHYEGERKTKHLTRILDDRSWIAEFFIPFKLLNPLGNVPPKPGTQWRANIYRIDYDQGQTLWTWQPINNSFHDYEMFGTFIFDH
jgi:hypothetical protein